MAFCGFCRYYVGNSGNCLGDEDGCEEYVRDPEYDNNEED